MSDELEIRKVDPRRVIPATPDPIAPPKPLAVGNPLLVSRSSPLPTACAQCGAPVHRSPSAVPFKVGPHQGGFLCRECWILEWAGNPDVAADISTRKWFAEEAQRIRTRRAGGSELLYSDGQSKAYLTPRGTVIIDLARLPFGSPDEYDADRYRTLLKIFDAIRGKGVPGYGEAASESAGGVGA